MLPPQIREDVDASVSHFESSDLSGIIELDTVLCAIKQTHTSLCNTGLALDDWGSLQGGSGGGSISGGKHLKTAIACTVLPCLHANAECLVLFKTADNAAGMQALITFCFTTCLSMFA